VAQNGPPDLLLTRTLKSAQLVRVPGVYRTSSSCCAAARPTSSPQTAKSSTPWLTALPGSKVVPGAFKTVRTTVALPKGRSTAAQAMLKAIVNEAKETGIARMAIERYQLKRVRAAQE
jgi:hypothetical protein